VNKVIFILLLITATGVLFMVTPENTSDSIVEVDGTAIEVNEKETMPYQKREIVVECAFCGEYTDEVIINDKGELVQFKRGIIHTFNIQDPLTGINYKRYICPGCFKEREEVLTQAWKDALEKSKGEKE